MSAPEQGEPKTVKATAFYSLISEVTHHDFCHVLLVRHTNFGTMRDSQGHDYQEVGTIDDGYREADCHSIYYKKEPKANLLF